MNRNSKRSTSQSWRQDNNDQYTNRGRQPSNLNSQRSYGATQGSYGAGETYGRGNYGSQRSYGSEQYDQHPTKNYGTHQGGMYGSKQGSFGQDDYGPQDGQRSQRTQYNNTRRNYGSQATSGSDYGARNDWGPERSSSSRDMSGTGHQTWDDGGYPSSGPTYGRHEQGWRGTNSDVSSQDYDRDSRFNQNRSSMSKYQDDYDSDLEDTYSSRSRGYGYANEEDDDYDRDYRRGAQRAISNKNFSSHPHDDEFAKDSEDMDEGSEDWGSQYQSRRSRGLNYNR